MNAPFRFVRAFAACITLLSVIWGLSGCRSRTGEPAGQKPLTIFAAASLAEAFGKLGQQFEAAHPGVAIRFSFAGSQQLSQQLAAGAPADIFASASLDALEMTIAAGRVATVSLQIFAANQLAVVLPDGNPGNVDELQDLARPGLRVILAAPEVPAGQYALEFLEKAKQTPELGAEFAAAVLKNVVSYEENVRAVLSKITLGEGDAGIVYTSDSAVNPDVLRLAIPPELNVIAVYPIAPLTDAPNPELAAAFIKYVLSPAGQATLAEYGFAPPP